jgi:hypothetical protein
MFRSLPAVASCWSFFRRVSWPLFFGEVVRLLSVQTFPLISVPSFLQEEECWSGWSLRS